jgi:hypothetical protein
MSEMSLLSLMAHHTPSCVVSIAWTVLCTFVQTFNPVCVLFYVSNVSSNIFYFNSSKLVQRRRTQADLLSHYNNNNNSIKQSRFSLSVPTYA